MDSNAFRLPEIPHPVLEVLRERTESGSAPGGRRDLHSVALVIEGGGMRGVGWASRGASTSWWARRLARSTGRR
jgi:hypothetical protein